MDSILGLKKASAVRIVNRYLAGNHYLLCISYRLHYHLWLIDFLYNYLVFYSGLEKTINKGKMEEIKLKAPAKINLFLKVLGKRDDGYHNIYSWFQTISLCDLLIIRKKSRLGNRLRIVNDIDLPLDDRNLIVKSANLLDKKFGLDGGVDIELEKNIPVSAGLGGGSSDAAATIFGMNRLFGLGLSPASMSKLALEIGSDVPFFFSSGQAEVTGRGENIRNIRLPQDYFIALIVPDISISTGDSYARLNLGLTSENDSFKLRYSKTFAELISHLGQIGNDFESVQHDSIKELEEIKQNLRNAGAALARMSGSGPSVFGLFKGRPDVALFEDLAKRGWHISVEHPMPCPLEFQ